MTVLTHTRAVSESETDRTMWAGGFSGEAEAAHESPLQLIWQRKWPILAFATAMTVVAAFIVEHMPPRYSAAASVMIDARKMQVIEAQSVLSNPLLDLDGLRTEMEQLQSPDVARAVVTQLDLTHNPEFCPDPPGLVDRLYAAVTREPMSRPTSCTVTAERATEQLLKMVTGSNDSRSYIIKVTAQAGDPVLAASIANAYAGAFVAAQRAQTTEVAAQADTWLSSYLEQLRTQMQAADTQVEEYERTHQLTSVHGETVVSQRLTELNSQYSVATSELAQKQSALQQVQSLGHGDVDVSAAPVVLASPVIQQLIERRSQLQATEADLRTRYGDAYPAVQSATAQVARMQQAIQIEIAKATRGLAGEVAALSARKTGLANDVNALQTNTARQGQDDVRLKELTRDAETDHRLYETMVTRLGQLDAERRMQWAGSSVVVQARAPLFAASPQKKMIVVGSFMAFLGLGSGVALALGLISPQFRDPDQVEQETGLRVLGLFPRPPRRCLPQDMAVDRPDSVQAETLHSLLTNLIGAGTRVSPTSGRIVMVTSALRGEGKSSFSVALGRSAVQAGLSVALLDCDLRRPAVAGLMSEMDRVDPASVAASGDDRSVELVRTACLDRRSRLQVLSLASCVTDARGLLVSPELSSALNHLRSQYDLVLIDTPPVLAVSDALNLASLADETIMVVDWRRTARHSVVTALRSLRRSNANVSGIVLAKADLRWMSRHNAAEGYYARDYSTRDAAWSA